MYRKKGRGWTKHIDFMLIDIACIVIAFFISYVIRFGFNNPYVDKVRAKVRCCDRDCWMIGSVSPAMHKYIWKPATWVLVHKFKALFTKHPYSMYELKICRDYRDGKVTKEELDKCSTCDMNCVINNGLSEASKEQLKHKTGEEIVDADIAQQLKN